jgi:hypothetical protein
MNLHAQPAGGAPYQDVFTKQALKSPQKAFSALADYTIPRAGFNKKIPAQPRETITASFR